jgi:hypothetical protein
MPARPEWADHAVAACAFWFDSAPAALRRRLAAVRARIARHSGGDFAEGMLTAPLLSPYFAMTEAFRRDLGLPPRGVVDEVGKGAVALYFYLRIQDDIIDEPTVFDPSYAYAAEMLAGASAEAFARAVGDRAAFWAFRRVILDELASTGAWEIDTYRSVDRAEASALAEEHAATLGSKLVPVAIPLAALAVAARREAHLEWLGEFARGFGAALQIANDLLNARDDHMEGRLTPSLAALYAGGRVAPSADAVLVWPALAGDPALPRMLDAARRLAGAAIELASRGGAPLLGAAAGESAALLDGIQPRLLKLALGVRP